MTGHEAERRALLAPVLLLLLAEREGHGYELAQRLGEFGCANTESAPVYRLLRALESDGDVLSHWDTSATGPARRVYSITPQGSMELALWFVRLGEVHGTLHVFLERYAQLEGVGSGAGEAGGARSDPRRPGHIRRMRR